VLEVPSFLGIRQEAGSSMDIDVSIEGVSKKVTLEPLSVKHDQIEGFRASIEGGSTRVIKILREGRGGYEIIVSIDEKVHIVKRLRGTIHSFDFLVDGELVSAYIGKGRQLASAPMTKSSAGIASTGEIVTANFPAKVVKVQISPGSVLNEGDVMMVLEAMKMEAQIKASSRCSVIEVYVREGSMVERGERLAKLKFQ